MDPATPPAPPKPHSAATDVDKATATRSLFTAPDTDMDLPSLSDSEYQPVQFDDDAARLTAVGFSDMLEVRHFPSDGEVSGKTMEFPTKRARRRHTEADISNLILIHQVTSSDPDVSPASRKEAAKRTRKLKHLRDTLRRVNSPPPSDESDINHSIDFDDLKTRHQEAEQAILNKTYVFQHQGKFVRHSMQDLDVTPPPAADIGVADRHCSFCNINVALHQWWEHIQTLYHSLSQQIWLNKLAHCWFKNLSIVPHERQGCQECAKRSVNAALRLPPWHDFARYVKDDDLDALAEVAAHQSDRPGKEYRCDTCNISMWSEDYWQRHVNGRKHQNKVKASTKGKQPVSTSSGTSESRPAQPTKKGGRLRLNPAVNQLLRRLRLPRQLQSPNRTSVIAKSVTHMLRRQSITGAGMSNAASTGPTSGTAGRRPMRQRLTLMWTLWLRQALRCQAPTQRRTQQLTLGATDEDALLITDEEGDVSDIPPISMDQCVDDFEEINVLRYLIRDELLTQKSYIDKIAICDEFTAATLPHSHSHVYLVTTEKHLFKEIKQFFQEEFHLDIKDIQRPRDLIKACRYITKNDRQAIIYNVPMKHASTTWRAHLYAQTHKQINWGHDIPASIAPCDRAVFTDLRLQRYHRRVPFL